MDYNVGANVKKRRKALGLTQVALAELSGLSQSAISDIENENGTKRPNTDTIQKLAPALQCTVSELLGERVEKEELHSPIELSPDELKLLQDYRSLNPQGKEYIRQTMFMALPIYKRDSNLSGLEHKTIG